MCICVKTAHIQNKNTLQILTTPTHLREGGWSGDSDDLVNGDEGNHDHGGAGHHPANHVSPPRVLLRVIGREWLVRDQTVHNDHLKGTSQGG